jgi:hypothetical protein
VGVTFWWLPDKPKREYPQSTILHRCVPRRLNGSLSTVTDCTVAFEGRRSWIRTHERRLLSACGWIRFTLDYGYGVTIIFAQLSVLRGFAQLLTVYYCDLYAERITNNVHFCNRRGAKGLCRFNNDEQEVICH